MPDSRWWNFEDAAVDFGQLDTEHVDLAKMLVMKFALVYGNDWFVVPLKQGIGSLTRVSGLIVTDTFGQRTIIRPAEQTTGNASESPWSMFKIGNKMQRTDYVFLALTIDVVTDADALEDVFFLRDDMAAMSWAVEERLTCPLDVGVDAFEAHLTRIRDDPPPTPPPVTATSPPVRYVLETRVPDNWIPLVPVRTPTGAPYLRRGLLVRATSAGFDTTTRVLKF